MPAVLMNDSVNPGTLPNAQYAALYADGDYAAPFTPIQRFPGVKWITVLGSEFAQIADFEKGNSVFSVPDRLWAWAGAMNHQGTPPIVYCDRSAIPEVESLLASQRHYLWVATLDGNELAADAYPNLWAVQYAGGGSAIYDTSIVYGPWLIPPQ